jgi:SAM-dependent methyltransferase
VVPSWIPAVDGLDAALDRGITVADVGCGHGSSTIILAQAYPNSTFVGFDYHEGSIAVARERALAAGVTDRVRFEVAPADAFAGAGYGLVCVFDALHDMGDPTAAASHIHASLATDGVFLLVEPNAHDRVEDNLNLVGRIFYSASTFVCTPASRAQGGADAACLGAQAGEARLRTVLHDAGFASVTRAAETPFNMVLAARP